MKFYGRIREVYVYDKEIEANDREEAMYKLAMWYNKYSETTDCIADADATRYDKAILTVLKQEELKNEDIFKKERA